MSSRSQLCELPARVRLPGAGGSDDLEMKSGHNVPGALRIQYALRGGKTQCLKVFRMIRQSRLNDQCSR